MKSSRFKWRCSLLQPRAVLNHVVWLFLCLGSWALLSPPQLSADQLVPPATPARPPSDQLIEDEIQKGLAAFGTLDYENALAIFQVILARPELAPATRARLKLFAGALNVLLNEKEKAIHSFEDAFRINPDISLPEPFLIPKIEKEFSKTQQEFYQQAKLSDLDAPKILFTPLSGKVLAGKRLDIQAVISDNIKVSDARVYYKRSEDINYFFTSMHLLMNNEYLASIPSLNVTGEEIAYYLEATDLAGNITHSGTPSTPHRVLVEKVKLPWYRSWIPWVLLTTAAGTSTALYYSLKNDPNFLKDQGPVPPVLVGMTSMTTRTEVCDDALRE
jgi:tetratricopeptide (TPR) repeat protein